MMKTWSLSKESSILIYGCNDIGGRLAQEILKKNYYVEAFIDENAKEIKQYKNIQVRSIDCIDGFREKAYVCFVALRNGMLHDSVAENLNNRGIDRIIYAPMYGDYNYRSTLRRVHNFFSHCEIECVNNVPYYNNRKDPENAHIRVIDDSHQNVITFWCPIDFIRLGYNPTKKNFLDEKARKVFCKYSGCLIKELTPYTHFLQFISFMVGGVKGEIDGDYIEEYFCMVGQYEDYKRKKWIEERKQLYLVYEEAVKYDLNFFSDAPIDCFWDSEEHCFMTVDGVTRSCYLINKGYEEIPICVSKDDFVKWRAEKLM